MTLNKIKLLIISKLKTKDKKYYKKMICSYKIMDSKTNNCFMLKS